MLVKFTEVNLRPAITSGDKKYIVRDVFISPKHVIYMREDAVAQSACEDGLFPEDISCANGFTKISINRGQVGGDITVMGDVTTVSNMLFAAEREMLHG